jgi:hypothetical protein
VVRWSFALDTGVRVGMMMILLLGIHVFATRGESVCLIRFWNSMQLD